MSAAPIRLHLSVGDALAFPADLAFIGDGPTLIDRIERGSGRSFRPTTYPESLSRKNPGLDGLKHSRELVASNFTWKRVVALGMRPSRRVRTSFLSEWLEVVMLPGLPVTPNEVVFVPFQRHPVEVVALTQLTLIWCMHRLRIGRRRLRCPQVTRIVDTGDVSLYRQFATTRWKETAAFIDRQLDRLWWAGSSQTMDTPEFELVATEGDPP